MAWLARFRNVVRPARAQRDLERELAFHLTERTEDLREAGMSEAAAARAARLQFGNFTAQVERTRDMDIHDWLESTVRNVRYAVRGLAKTPAFTATVILTLALAIGANSAVFSAIYAVLLRPLPFPNGDQLVKLSQAHPKVPQPFLAPVRLEEWNRQNDTLQAITGYYSEDVSELSGELPEKLERVWVAPRFLQVMGVAPSLGRDFSPEEERFGGPNAVLISDRLWRRRFDGNPNAIGKTLRIGTTAWSIIGIMPASFRFPDRDADLWSASPIDAPFAQGRELTWFTAIGRLKAGVPLARARANLDNVQANLARQYAKTDAEIRPLIDPLKEATVGGTRKSLWILFGSVSLLLLIACTNIAALLLSRATGRRHEISVRFSLGASRAAVAAQLLTEVLILALAGAALGLLLATSASGVFRALGQGPAAHRRDRLEPSRRMLFAGLRRRDDADLRTLSGHPRDEARSCRLAGACGPLAGVRTKSHAVRAGGRAGGLRGNAAGGGRPAAAQLSGTRPRVAGLRAGTRAHVSHQYIVGRNRRSEGRPSTWPRARRKRGGGRTAAPPDRRRRAACARPRSVQSPSRGAAYSSPGDKVGQRQAGGNACAGNAGNLLPILTQANARGNANGPIRRCYARSEIWGVCYVYLSPFTMRR